MNLLRKHPKKLVNIGVVIFLIFSVISVLAYNYLHREQVIYKPLENLEEIDTIEYSYIDASVEPKYHRSYRIILSESGNGMLYVTSYSTLLNQVSFTLTKEQFEVIKKNIQNTIQQKEILNQNKQKYICVGGSSKKLILSKGETSQYSLVFAQPCHSNDSIDNSTGIGGIEEIAKTMQSLVPNFSDNLQKVSQ